MSASDDGAGVPPTVPDGPTRPRVPNAALPERYEDRGIIGRGGHGEVRRAWDRLMERDVAIKVLAWHHVMEGGAGMKRFIHEARTTAQLAHPGVVPVHERGTLADGRPFFVMKVVEGRTLGEVMRSARVPDEVLQPDAWSLRRLISAFVRVAETVAYAHGRGVVHCDLKPSNLMVGDFGEVFVMDWGIARVTSRDGWDPRLEDADTAPVGPTPEGSLRNSSGNVVGTVAYMAPEQALADPSEIRPATDVYALGLVLGEIMTGRAVNGSATPRQVFARMLHGEAPSLPTIPGRAPPPEELCDIFHAAVAFEPAERFVTAVAMADALRAWLDDEARRERAARVIDLADQLGGELRRLRNREAELRRIARRALAALAANAPKETKRPGWKAEDEAEEVAAERERIEDEVVECLRGALQFDPGSRDAHRRLATLFRARVEAAEAAGDARAAARHEVALRRHDRGEHARFIEGLGEFSIPTVPGETTVEVARFYEEERLSKPIVIDTLGPERPANVVLPAGSYLLSLSAPGYDRVSYPIRLERAARWSATPPGGQVSEPVQLPPSGRLGPDEVYVPAGWIRLGGDPEASQSQPGTRAWVPGFVMARTPVVWSDYLAFLDDLVARGEAEEARRRLPTRTVQGRPEPKVELEGNRHRLIDNPFFGAAALRHPVTFISLHDAWAFARWKSAGDGRRWRLPMEAEWEKAARGVDGRPYPWGRRFDVTFANVAGALDPEPPRQEPVDVRREDVSVYGVWGMGGNVRQWCAEPYAPEGAVAEGEALAPVDREPSDDRTLHSVRGSVYFTRASPARICARFAAYPSERTHSVGFRLVYSYPP